MTSGAGQSVAPISPPLNGITRLTPLPFSEKVLGVSIKLMSAVWHMKLNHTDKLVLLALADNANDDGVCWPSIKTICKKTCLSERGVQASLQRLIETNVLQRIIRNGRSSNFYVRPP